MTPVLQTRGFLLLGPTQQLFVSKSEHIESEVLELISEENMNLPEGKAPVERVDIRVIELFNKDWCGSLDLSEEGVAALEDWDTAFGKKQAQIFVGQLSADTNKTIRNPILMDGVESNRKETAVA